MKTSARLRLASRRLSKTLLTAVIMLVPLQQPASAGGEEGCLTSKINAERQAQGAGALSSHSGLVSIARRHSARMAEDQRYYHNSNLRSELPSGWRSEGENVGWATDCAHMHNFFMNSPSHRKNILNPAFNQIGVGVVTDSGGKHWVTEVFMESSGRTGFSIEPSPALKAPDPKVETPPPAEEVSQPPGGPESKIARSEPLPKASPRGSSVFEEKAPVPKASSAPKKSGSAPRQPGVATLAYQEALEKEPAWEEFASSRTLMIFDLDPSV